MKSKGRREHPPESSLDDERSPRRRESVNSGKIPTSGDQSKIYVANEGRTFVLALVETAWNVRGRLLGRVRRRCGRGW